MNYYFEFVNPVSTLRITENGQAITSVYFTINHPLPPPDAEANETPLIKETCRQLSEYFAGKRTVFDVPLETNGTDFQRRVWRALCTIPYSETRSYGQIASIINCPEGARAVGMANNRNPISIIIPCHRVIGANGSLTGYAAGVAIKEKLLQIERGR